MGSTQELMAPLGTCPALCSASAAPVQLHKMDGAAPAELAAAALCLSSWAMWQPCRSTAARSRPWPASSGCTGPRSAQDALPRVPAAEVRADPQVDQVVSLVGLEETALGQQDVVDTDLLPVNLCYPVRLFLEDIAHVAEGRHDLPAGVHLAGARHAIELALHLHAGQESLWSSRQLPT